MNDKEKLELDMNKLKEKVKEEVNKTWKEGFAKGAVTTCTILYKTFQLVGLEETNMLFTILKDIAEKNGCKDLIAEVAKLSTQK